MPGTAPAAPAAAPAPARAHGAPAATPPAAATPTSRFRPRAARPSFAFALALAAAALAVLTSLAACGSSNPTPSSTPTPSPTPTAASASPATPSPTPPPGASPTTSPADAAIYDQIERQVEQLRGLRATRPVVPRLIDEAGLRAYVARSLAETLPARLDASDALLRALGLLPDGSSLGELFSELFTAQIAGFYDPETKALNVVTRQGGLGPVEKVTFAHEFTHALQDQHFPTFRADEFQGAASGIIRTPDGQSDRSLATLGLVEGDPTLVMTLWAQQHLQPSELEELLAASSDPQTAKVLAEMPAILRDTLLYPYTAGLGFVLGRQLAGGWAAVDRLYANPPTSTEQVLHPEKYGVDEPVTVTLPADLARRLGGGWVLVQEDTLGELQLRSWLQIAGSIPGATTSSITAQVAAAGWGGDRIALFRGPKGAWALVLRTAWDTAADADEFALAAPGSLASTPIGPNVIRTGVRTVDYVAGSTALAEALLTRALGHEGD